MVPYEPFLRRPWHAERLAPTSQRTSRGKTNVPLLTPLSVDFDNGNLLMDFEDGSGSESEDGFLAEHDVDIFGSKYEEYGQAFFQDAFMAGKAARSEVNLKILSPERRALFDVAMQKEWTSWQRFQAVEELTEEDYKSLPADTKIIGTRWAHGQE